jgi:hypothetical protein
MLLGCLPFILFYSPCYLVVYCLFCSTVHVTWLSTVYFVLQSMLLGCLPFILFYISSPFLFSLFVASTCVSCFINPLSYVLISLPVVHQVKCDALLYSEFMFFSDDLEVWCLSSCDGFPLKMGPGYGPENPVTDYHSIKFKDSLSTTFVIHRTDDHLHVSVD